LLVLRDDGSLDTFEEKRVIGSLFALHSWDPMVRAMFMI
jgi:hypothetical protein